MTKPLDPEPWVDPWGRYAVRWNPADVFNPRPEYEQDRSKY